MDIALFSYCFDDHFCRIVHRGRCQIRKIGIRKPERQFYLHACQALDVSPNHVIFLDDLGINLKPARELGMHTIKVLSSEQALRDLEALLGHEIE